MHTFAQRQARVQRPSTAQADVSPLRQSSNIRRLRPSQVPAVRSPEGTHPATSVLDVVGKGGGEPLAPDVLAEMQDRLGDDFSHVRVHTNEQAASSVEAVGAKAYTVGSDIAFAAGSYDPGSTEGRRVLAHELVHVLQQRKGPVSGTDSGCGFAVSDPTDAFEAEAEVAANRFSSVAAPIAVADTVVAHAGAPRHTANPVVQRALPVAVEALEVGLTAAIVAQEQAAITQGGIHYQSDKGSRHGDRPQPVDQEYSAEVLRAGQESPVLPNVLAIFKVHWQGNQFGEMGGAYVQLSLQDSTEFHEHGSALNVHFTVLDTMPKKGNDPRLWSMQWIYDGNFDPLGPGQYAFSGKFEIDAFGGFRSLEHVVVDQSLIESSRSPKDDFVRPGVNIEVLVAP